MLNVSLTVAYPFLNVAFPIRLAIYSGACGIAIGAFKILNGLHGSRPLVPSVYGLPIPTIKIE